MIKNKSNDIIINNLTITFHFPPFCLEKLVTGENEKIVRGELHNDLVNVLVPSMCEFAIVRRYYNGWNKYSC